MNKEMFIEIKDRRLARDMVLPYIIAEIGCNHNGNIRTALKMIKVAADCGADAVKFQKRDPDMLFTPDYLQTTYFSENSHGKTYGEHRRYLDNFEEKEWLQIGYECRDQNISFICTPFTEPDADFLDCLDFKPDAYKIASCDLKNLPLIEKVSSFNRPIIVSTGGSEMQDIDMAVKSSSKPPIILHCISTYPNDDRLFLRRIEYIRASFTEHIIGFSSHHAGLLPFPIAYMKGARVFEVHFTLNRGQKGTDHGFSLEPAGLHKLCEDSKRFHVMLDDWTPKMDQVAGFITKMGKSIYAAREIKFGTEITAEDLCLKAPADGLPPRELLNILGSVATRDYKKNDLIEK